MSSSSRGLLRVALVAAALAWMPSFEAHEHDGCLEVNNTSNNRLGVFQKSGETGEIKWVQEVETGGMGRNGGYISIPQIVSTPAVRGKACVFAVNAATHDVSAFEVTIEKQPDTPCNCHNKLVGRPVSIGTGALFGPLGGGVAVTPDGKALFTANPGSSDITVFDVLEGCELRRREPRLPTVASPSDIQIDGEGTCLAVTSPVADRVVTYRVNLGTTSTPSPGTTIAPILAANLAVASAATVPGTGRATGLQFTTRVAQKKLYVSKAALGQAVITRFDVAPDCRLTLPVVTTVATGRMSSLAVLDPENKCLYAPNHAVPTYAVNHPPTTWTTFSVDPTLGSLRHVTTVDDGAFYPSGIGFGTTYRGDSFLYYTSFTRHIFRRPLESCVPGPVVLPGVPASNNPALPATGPLRTLTIIQ